MKPFPFDDLPPRLAALIIIETGRGCWLWQRADSGSGWGGGYGRLADWQRVVTMDAQLRLPEQIARFRGELFRHSSRVPLSVADIDAPPTPLFGGGIRARMRGGVRAMIWSERRAVQLHRFSIAAVERGCPALDFVSIRLEREQVSIDRRMEMVLQSLLRNRTDDNRVGFAVLHCERYPHIFAACRRPARTNQSHHLNSLRSVPTVAAFPSAVQRDSSGVPLGPIGAVVDHLALRADGGEGV